MNYSAIQMQCLEQLAVRELFNQEDMLEVAWVMVSSWQRVKIMSC